MKKSIYRKKIKSKYQGKRKTSLKGLICDNSFLIFIFVHRFIYNLKFVLLFMRPYKLSKM